MFKMTMREYCNKWKRSPQYNLVISFMADYTLNELIDMYEDDKFWEKIAKVEIEHGNLPWKSPKSPMKGIAANSQEVADAYRTVISILKGL